MKEREREREEEIVFFEKHDWWSGIRLVSGDFQKNSNIQLELSFFLILKVESSTVYTEAIPGPSLKATAFPIV